MNDSFAKLLSDLRALGSKDYEWFERLSEAEQKAAAPFVMMRWMCGTNDPVQILRINTAVNQYVFTGTADKAALFKLLAAGATGTNKSYTWLKGPGTKSKKLSLEVIMQYYDCSSREAASYRVAGPDLLEMAEELGWEKEELTKLKKEFDDGPGTIEKSVSKPKKLASRR